MVSAFVEIGDQPSQDAGQNIRTRFIRRIRSAAIGLLLGCWVLLAVSFIFRTSHVSINQVRYFLIFDDGMVSLRYAKNFVQHRGLVWNVGERVEGFTNPLWTFLMIGGIWLSGAHYAPLLMQILGGIIYLAILWIYYRTAVRNKSSGLGFVTGFLLLLCSYPLSFWALSGMETIAVCLAFAISIGAQYSYENRIIGNPLILNSCLIAIAYCLRPDGWLVITPFFAACWLHSVKEKRYRLAFFAPAMICAVVLIVLLARVAYYGEWVPNTYVLKVEGFSLALRLRNGMAYLRQFRDENLILLALIALSAFSKRRVACLNIVAACIALGYQVYVGGDPWLYWRQLLPIYVSAAFAALILLDHLRGLSVSGREASAPSPVVRALALIFLFTPFVFSEYLIHFGVIPWIYRQDFLAVYVAAALACLASLIFARKISLIACKSQLLLSVTRMLILVIVAGSIVAGNRRFLPELRGKPFSFSEQAELIDKAVLSNRLFGAGRTHHMAWAGTYPYYVEGTMIDALGKSDKVIARFPVDEAAAWNGMRGVPGHAKYDLRETILRRKPDIIVDYTVWGRQDLSQELENNYTLIKSNGVSLCVKKELTVGIENLVSGSCPHKML